MQPKQAQGSNIIEKAFTGKKKHFLYFEHWACYNFD